MGNIKEYTVQGKKYRMRLFDKIEFDEEAYLIGYLLGDGGFNRATHKRKSMLFVSSIDKELVYSMRDLFSPDTIISNITPINKKRLETKFDKYSYKLQFPFKFFNTFNKFGLMDVKSNRNYFNIPKSQMNNLLLGLFDSYGHISWGRRKDRNRLWANFTITHPNLKMLYKIQVFLSEELNVSSYIAPRKIETVYDLKTSKRDDIITIMEYLYSSEDLVLYSKHKKKKYLEFKKEYI